MHGAFFTKLLLHPGNRLVIWIKFESYYKWQITLRTRTELYSVKFGEKIAIHLHIFASSQQLQKIITQLVWAAFILGLMAWNKNRHPSTNCIVQHQRTMSTQENLPESETSSTYIMRHSWNDTQRKKNRCSDLDWTKTSRAERAKKSEMHPKLS